MRNALFAATLGVLLIGCRSVQPDPDPRLTRPETWQRVDADSLFTFVLPPGLKEQDGFGIDSYVGVYQGPSVRLSYDYGMWSGNPGRSSRDQAYASRPTIIDGAAATPARREVRERDASGGFRYFASVYFPKTPCRAREPRDALQMGASCKTEADCAAMQRVFKSIRFLDHRCPSGPFEMDVAFDEVHFGADSTRISGRVTLADDGESIPGVNVAVARSRRSRPLLGAATDKTGRFEVAGEVGVAATDSVFVSMILFYTEAFAVSDLQKDE